MAQGRDIDVTCVPVTEVAEAVDERTDVVAVSAVQSATGEVASTDAVIEAASSHGATLAVDATQACGWLPLDAPASTWWPAARTNGCARRAARLS